MNLTDFTTIIDKYGISGGIILVILVFLFILVKTEWFGTILKHIFERHMEKSIKTNNEDSSKVRNITDSDISNHDIFNYIDFWMFSKVPTFQFSSEYRTVVFRKYLTIYLKSYKKNIDKFIVSKEYQEMDDAKLTRSLLSLINIIVYDYEKEAEDFNIPKIVIEKIKAKNNDTITLTLDLIEGVCNSQFYSSDKNLLKVYSILNILLSVLENTISNSQPVCDSINGALKNLIFTENGKEYKEP